MTVRIHSPGPGGWKALCRQPWPEKVAEDRDAVTCLRCLARLPDAPPAPDASYPRPLPYAGPAQRLDPRSLRAIMRSRGEQEAPATRWPHPEAAVRAWVAVRDASSLRSSGDPARADRVQANRDPSAGGSIHARIRATRNVALALERAVATAPGPLPSHLALEAYLMRVAGRGVRRAVLHRKGTHPMRLGTPASEVAERFAERTGIRLDARDIADIMRHFNGRVRLALRESGELPGAATREREAWDPLRRVREVGT